MAIEKVVGTQGGSNSTAELTNSFNIAASDNRVLIIIVSTGVAGAFVNATGVTWNGTALTKLGDNLEYRDTGGLFASLSYWYLIAPDTGNHNAITTFDGTTATNVGYIVISNVKQQAPQATGRSNGNSTSPSVSLTTVTPNAWIVDALAFADNALTATEESSYLVTRVVTGASNVEELAGSYKHIRDVGSASSSWTLSGSEKWAMIAAAWQDIEPSGGKLELRFEGVDGATTVVDSTGHHSTINFNNSAQLDSAQFKCGASSLLLDSSTEDDLDIPASNDFNIARSLGDDWTVDCFVKLSTHAGTDTICGQRVNSALKWLIENTHGSGLFFSFATGSGGGVTLSSASAEIDDSDWHHIAVVKVQKEWAVYKDGVQVMYGTEDTLTIEWDVKLDIGTDSATGAYLNGWIDEFNIARSNKFSASPNVGLTDTITVRSCPITTGPGLTYCSYVEDGQVRKMVTAVSGLDHLEGEAIKIQMDGILPTNASGKLVSNSFTVSSGAITLPKAAAVVHAGLPYDGIIRMLKQSGGSAIGSGQTKMRRTYLAVVRFFKSLGLKVGPDEDNLSPIFDVIPALPLISSDKRKLPKTNWDDETEMVFKMEDPLPCLILAILLESEVEEKG